MHGFFNASATPNMLKRVMTLSAQQFLFLSVNTVNSIEQFTEDHFSAKQGDGLLSCMVDEPVSKETQLLLNSMILGLQDIQEHYGREYLQLIFEEV